MKAVDPEKIVKYTPKCDREKRDEEQTIFLVKVLTGRENASLRDDLYDVTGTGKNRKEVFKTGTQELKALQIGLKGWSNFAGDNGDITFDGTDIDKMIDKTPQEVREELSNFIRGESTASDRD